MKTTWNIVLIVACAFAAVVLLLFAYSMFFESHLLGMVNEMVFGAADVIGALACLGVVIKRSKALRKEK